MYASYVVTFALYRKLETTKLENAILKDPTIHSHRTAKSRSQLVANLYAKGPLQYSLLHSIQLIEREDIMMIYESATEFLGEGRFEKCSLKLFCHFEVCMKQFKNPNNNAFIKEANILSKFHHPNLSYLFGVCVGDNPALILSFHGIDNIIMCDIT